LSDFDAEIDMARPQSWCRIVVNVPMKVDKPWGKWNNRTVGEDQVQSCVRVHPERVFDQRDPKTMVERNAAPIMIAAHEKQLAVEFWNQSFGIYLFPQSQIPEMENYIVRADPPIPVLDDQILPIIRPAAIFGDIGMKEMSVRN